MKIMFICTGNICRSAMAEAMLKKLLKEENKNGIEVCSAGIYAENGDEPTNYAVEVMEEEYDINLKKHKATNIKQSNIEQMDLILCATNPHKIAVSQMYPDLKQKIYTIKEYAGVEEGQNDSISDPWGYPKSIYRKCAEEIEENLEKIVKKL